MAASGAARRRAASADRAGGLRDHAVVLLRPADAADRTHQRHGGRADVDSARRSGPRICPHRDRHRMAARSASSEGRRTRPQATRPHHDIRAGRRADHAAAARLSDLHGAADGGDGRAGVFHERAAGRRAPEPVRIGQCDAAARGAVLHLCRRADGARQRRATAGRFRAGRRRLGARQPRRHRGRHLGDFRGDLRRKRRDRCHHRQGDGAGDEAGRLSGDVHRGPDHRGRRDRRDHPAEHPDDRLRLGGGGIGGAALRRRRYPRADDRRNARGLRGLARQARRLRPRRGVRSQAVPARHRAQRLGARRAGHHPRRHLWRRVLADRGRGRRLRLCRVRHRLHLPRARLARHRRSRGLNRAVHRADPDHRCLRRRVRLAAHGQSGAGDGDGLAAIAQRFLVDAAARDQHPAARGRLLSRSAVGDPVAQPAAGADDQGGRHRSRALRHHRDGQSRDRAVSPAVRHQHLRRADRARPQARDDLSRHHSVRGNLPDRARHHHLRSGPVADRRSLYCWPNDDDENLGGSSQ